MASDFEDIRAGMETKDKDASSGQGLFMALLMAVLVVGAGIGYLVLPRDAAPQTTSASGYAQAATKVSAKPKKFKKSELKKMRRAAIKMYMETQGELMSCAQSQRHMAGVFQAYSARNLPKYQAWNDLLSPTSKLAKLGKDKNSLEAQAYIITGGMQNDVQETFQDINMQLNSYGKQIDPVKCGQLNAAVQRRQRDLEMPPSI